MPHEKNNHKAWLLHPYAISLFIVIYLANQSLIGLYTKIKPGVLGYSSEITAQKIFQETNLERQKNNLPILHYNSTLSKSATAKGNDMFTSDYWAHNSPSGKTPWDFFKSVNYDYQIAGENLARDFYDNENVIKAWMNSPTHRANIVNNKYKEIGIGVVDGVLNGVKTTLVIQHFGTPVDVSTIADKTTEEIQFNAHPLADASDSVKVLSQNSSVRFSPLTITKYLSGLIFLIILSVIFIDGYMTLKNKTHRFSGSNAGHFVFLLVIFILIIFLRQGNIF
jgi:hypothetical protein